MINYILPDHYSRGISHFSKPFGCIAQKLANDQLLHVFCALHVDIDLFRQALSMHVITLAWAYKASVAFDALDIVYGLQLQWI